MTAPVRLGVLMLCHQALDRAAQAARLWTEGSAAVTIHIDARSPATDAEAMRTALTGLPDLQFARRHACRWGDFSLVAATQEAAALLLRDRPDITHVLLVSGSCLPLRPVAELTGWLARNPACEHIESVSASEARWVTGGLDIERFTLFSPFDWRRNRRLFDRAVRVQRRLGIRRQVPAGIAPHLGSQWWCLTAATLRAILDDPRRAEFERYFRRCWIPDESYFQTLARRHSSCIDSRSPVLARFDASGRPHVLYDDHLPMLEDSRCFVARKVWPGAEALYRHFPKPASDPAAAPDPTRFDHLADAANARRREGRPGLYMQSRFPRKDAENGKTAGSYAVFCGLSGVFPDWRDWLAGRIDADVHGHLFGPEDAEFASGAPIGPGALPATAGLRDLDPRGYLAALLRSTSRRQAFQFGPHDNQALNWFMATDPNASIIMVTGGWIAPLLTADMPFDDVRRIYRHLRWVESSQLGALSSVWRRARLLQFSLPDLMADPAGWVNAALRLADPRAAPATDLPAMRPLDGLPALLQRLRNSGLPGDIDLSQQRIAPDG